MGVAATAQLLLGRPISFFFSDHLIRFLAPQHSRNVVNSSASLVRLNVDLFYLSDTCLLQVFLPPKALSDSIMGC